MDINSNNRLARMEYEQRTQSAPVIPDYGYPNVEIQPGWALRLARRFLSSLRNVFHARDKHPSPIRETRRGSTVVEPR